MATEFPSTGPSERPSLLPSKNPSVVPSNEPTAVISDSPSVVPSSGQSLAPTGLCERPTLGMSIDFENNVALNIIGAPAQRPWKYDTNAGCDGTSQGLRAEGSKGGKSDTTVLGVGLVLFTAPTDASSVSYFYSHSGNLAAGVGDAFHVFVNGNLVKSYETELGEGCTFECISVSPGDDVSFRCASDDKDKYCSIDQIQFYGSGRRKLASGDAVSEASIPVTPQPFNPTTVPDYPFSAFSEFTCSKETAGQECPDVSSGQFNCCSNSGNYGCGTCATCDGWGQLLNGRDEMGKSCCDNSFLAENTTVKCLGKYGEMNYDMCCKTTTRKDKQRRHDFYCFIDKGSSRGNNAYCLGLADNPPEILWSKRKRKPKRKKPPKLIRGSRRNRNHDNKMMVLMLIGMASSICLILWRRLMRIVEPPQGPGLF